MRSVRCLASWNRLAKHSCCWNWFWRTRSQGLLADSKRRSENRENSKTEKEKEEEWFGKVWLYILFEFKSKNTYEDLIPSGRGDQRELYGRYCLFATHLLLVTTIIPNDKGIALLLPESVERIVPIHQRNIFKIQINSQNNFLVNGWHAPAFLDFAMNWNNSSWMMVRISITQKTHPKP